MIVTEVPTLDENLKKVTPWWDVIVKYLIAAMMAIALTSIAVQVTKDNLICVPAIDCSNITLPNGSLAANISDVAAKLCKSLMPKSLKKKVLAKMVDRRFYDYVDSVCYQKLSCFTKFFPLILLVEAVLLLVFDIMWTKLPFSSSVLNHFVSLADEGYSSLATIDIILRRGFPKQVEKREEAGHGHASTAHDSQDISSNEKIPLHTVKPMNQATALLKRSIAIPEADALKVLNLAEKAEHFRKKYAQKLGFCKYCKPNKFFCFCCKISLHGFYIMRIFLQLVICIISLIFNLLDCKNFSLSFSNIAVDFKCDIDEIIFTEEYEHFECSHPLAPYFQIALILFLISLGLHFVISGFAFAEILHCGTSYTFPDLEEGTEENDESKTFTSNDFAFLFYLLKKHDELYADRVSYFFRPGTYDELPGNILRYMSENK